MVNKLSYLWLTILLLTHLSCSIIDRSKTDRKESEPIKLEEPEIFYRDREKILNDIESMLVEKTEMYSSFKNNSIILNIFCDTIDCSIDSVKVESDRGFVEYSEMLTSYFAKMSPINCKHQIFNDKIGEFDVLIGSRVEGLIMNIDYGYKRSSP